MKTVVLVAMVAGIFAVDIIVPLGVAGGVPYVLVLLLVARVLAERWIWVAAGLTSVLTAIGFFLSPEGSVLWQVLANRFLALSLIWATAILSIRLKRSEARRVIAVQEAQIGREQIRFREQIEFERARLQAILEASAAAVVVVDASGRVLLANDEASTIHGRVIEQWEPHEDLHRHITILRPDGSILPEDELPLNRALRAQQYTYDLELVFQRRGGSKVPALISAAPVINQMNEVVAAVSVFQDISRLKQMEATRDEFLSRVTHDLRGPLATMRSIATAAIESPISQREELLEDMQLILEEGERMTELVTNLLDITRIETGALKPELEEAHVGDVASEAVRRASASKLGRDRTIHQEVVGDLPSVTMDPVMIRRVLENLLSNALKYSDGEVVVRVQTRSEGNAVLVSVVDHGPGVPSEKREAIFDKFSSGETASQTSGLGAGMGLAVSKAILNAHGGHIWVEGEPGQGATFAFQLPFAEVDASGGASGTSRPS